ncbi:MAG: hypothetical protein Q7R97_02475 [Candidatus Daviesbacteria bacterium]|nr:hypothetical protein [Candidatus Daviesbacteria bacterium]
MKEVCLYLTGLDFVMQRAADEQKVLSEAVGDTELHLSFDAGFNVGVRVFANRVRTMLEMPIVVASRITGVDLAVRKFREHLNRQP